MSSGASSGSPSTQDQWLQQLGVSQQSFNAGRGSSSASTSSSSSGSLSGAGKASGSNASSSAGQSSSSSRSSRRRGSSSSRVSSSAGSASGASKSSGASVSSSAHQSSSSSAASGTTASSHSHSSSSFGSRSSSGKASSSSTSRSSKSSISSRASKSSRISSVSARSSASVTSAHSGTSATSTTSGVSSSSSATKPLKSPPDGVLARAGDGQLYWVPNPAAATWGSGAPPPSDDWVKDFLIFYGFGPPDDIDSADGTQCIFNAAASTIDAVVNVLVNQASLAGYQAEAGKTKTIAKDMYNQRLAGKKKGADIVKKGATDLSSLRGLDMASLLDALEVVRKSGKLDDLSKQTTDPRMLAAVLSVQHHLGDRWAGYVQSLSSDDQLAIRQHIYAQMLKGDVGDTKPLSGPNGPFVSPPVSEEDWITGFLNWFNLSTDPLNNDKFLFNGKTTATGDIVDTVIEQGALAGYLLSKDTVRR